MSKKRNVFFELTVSRKGKIMSKAPKENAEKGFEGKKTKNNTIDFFGQQKHGTSNSQKKPTSQT